MSKTIVAPLIAYIFLTLQVVFHVEVDEATKQQITLWVADGVALGLIFYGIYKNHKKKEEKK
jgi:hypothetical protein